MSLLHDPDYISHALRLAYLRHVEDPYGSRVISFNPIYGANPYIRAAGFADTDAWPQLTQPESPKPVESQLAPPPSPNRQDNFLTRVQDEDTIVAPEAGVYPGANLKYSDTIMGPSRTGLAGMRVSGRRHSGQVRGNSVRSASALSESQSRLRSDSAPNLVPGSANPHAVGSNILSDPTLAATTASGNDEEHTQKRNSTGSGFRVVPMSSLDVAASNGSTPTATVPGPSRLASETPVGSPGQAQSLQPPIVNIPIFARAAEMEERRRQRIRARFAPSPSNTAPVGIEPAPSSQVSRGNTPAPRRAADTLSLSGTIDSRTSREEEGSGTIDGEGDATGALEDSEDDDTDEDADADADADADDMDAEMAESGDQDDLSLLYNTTYTTTNVNPSGSSDENSFLSGNSTNSLSQHHSQSFAPPAPRTRRLSPVTESTSEIPTSSVRHTPQSVRIPMPRPISIHSPPAPPTPRASGTRSRAYSSAAGFRVPSPEEPPMVFTRLPVPSRQSTGGKSALTEALAARSTGSDNPFTELYGAISGRAEQGAVPFRLWFPHANRVKDKDRRGRTIEKPFSLEVKVRRDALAEELIGFGLWAYWESEQEPRLDEGLQGKTQVERDARLSSAGWNLRMWEDGEVDTDFPAIARTQTMAQIKTFEELAIVEATPEQVQQNLAGDTSIARRPSRMMVTKPRQDSNTTSGLAPPGAATGQTGPVPMMSSSDVVTSNILTGASFGATTSVMPGGPPIFLKIKVAAKADVHYSTTINVTADTYMADVLEQVCRKRRLQDAKEWALMTENPSILIPLDRTVASLTGTKELLLVKRSLLDSLGLGKHSRVPRSSDPNASIFDMLQDANPGRGFSSSMDYREAYKKFTVHRKIPMLVGRHERIIAIDGDYVHIMPSNNRAFLDTMKTSSYHIKTVIGCKKTKKAPNSIKLVVLRDGGSKRYDFEAEDEKQAGEIVETIKNLQKQYMLDRTADRMRVFYGVRLLRGVEPGLVCTSIAHLSWSRLRKSGSESSRPCRDTRDTADLNIGFGAPLWEHFRPISSARMSRIPPGQPPAPPGAPSPDAQHPTQLAQRAAQLPASHVPLAQAQGRHDMPRAGSSSSAATSVTSGSSGLSIQTVPTDITRPSSFTPSETPHSPEPKLRQQARPDIARPAPVPLQGVSPPTRFRQSDPGQASGAVQPRTGQDSADAHVPRRQTLPSESASAFGKPRPFNLSQPPRSYRAAPRGSSGRLWGREGLPTRLYENRHAPSGSPLATPSDVLPNPYQAQRLSGNISQYTIPIAPMIRPTHQPIPDIRMVPRAPLAAGNPASLQGAARPPEPSGGFMSMAPNPSALSMHAPLNPLDSSLTRDAMLAHALKLYENPGVGSRPPLGLTTRPLDPEASDQEAIDPMRIYSIELLPLLTSLRALHPTHPPTALLLACVQYALNDYEGSLRTNREILALNPNFVEAMSNIATTLRALGNLHEAESWWRRAVQLRPSYWDAVDNLIGVLCGVPRATDTNIPPGADQPRLRQALDVCEFVLKQMVPGPTILSSLSTGLIQQGESHRLQNILHTSGNLKFLLAIAEDPNPEKEFSGLRDQFAAVELMLNNRTHTEHRTDDVYLTTHDLLLGLAVSALYVTGNLPSIPELEAEIKSNPSRDLPYHIHNTQHAVLNALTSNNVLPLLFVKPENIFSVMTYLFSSTKGLFPGVIQEARNLNLEAIPAVLPTSATNASRMTATVLLTVAKHLQEAARRGDALPYLLPSNGHGVPVIRASLSAALLLYYCALALHPSASVCNNLGILLSTLVGERITCLAQPPDSTITQPAFEVLTGPSLARTYYHQGLILDPNHPHLLTNMGSLLKDEGKVDDAIRVYSRALEIKPDFDVALANIANATKDAGRIIESIEYYKRAVLANPYFPESIVGLANVLGSVCDWQGRGGLSSDLYLDVGGRIVTPNENQASFRSPGFLDKLLEICDSQIISGYRASSGIIASDRTLEQWMETIESCLGPLSPERKQRWEISLKRFYSPFDRAEKRVYEAGVVVRLVELLSRVLQRRWYVDMYGSGTYSTKEKARELDISKYYRPRLPAAMVAPLALSILPFHTFTLPLSTRRIRIVSHRNAIRTSYLALTQDWLPPHVYKPPPPPNGGRLKVAYISRHLMQSVFRFHNAERFEIYCYATTASDGSVYRTTIETSAHHFLDVSSWSIQAIVERIQNDGVHILINLNGYTKGARNDIFVVRPAPIVISLMGFAGTMASGWSDYILTDLQACSPLGSAMEVWRTRRQTGGETSRMQDHFTEMSLEHDFDIDPDPESTSEDWMFSEKLILMPHTCFVTDHKQSFREDDQENMLALHGRDPTNELIWKFEEIRRHRLRRSLFPDVPDDWIIYANFNQLYKVDPVGYSRSLSSMSAAKPVLR
ncbi:unnamed protein product [Rhizoctonia solani]|uniref:protein O-GlcNAc transferase n=1 Tax=Rhizoctonia solani TaxID=456999 RepID=A0A8H2WY92_9AGAM|nr:unnamed protein product [Rhizoctonia solani]